MFDSWDATFDKTDIGGLLPWSDSEENAVDNASVDAQMDEFWDEMLRDDASSFNAPLSDAGDDEEDAPPLFESVDPVLWDFLSERDSDLPFSHEARHRGGVIKKGSDFGG